MTDENDKVNSTKGDPLIEVEYGEELVKSRDVSILNSLVSFFILKIGVYFKSCTDGLKLKLK